MASFIRKVLDSPTLMSWSGVLIRFGTILFVFPLVLTVYSPVQQSFWFFINTLIGFAMLADAGFGSTLIRAVAYFKAGADEIPRTRKEYDEAPELKNTGPNIENVGKLLATTHRIYLYLILFLLLMLCTLGVILVWNIMELAEHSISLWMAYGLIAVYSIVMISGIKWSSYLRGLGLISFEARYSILFDAAQVLGFIILLSFKLPPVYLVALMATQVTLKTLFMRNAVLKWFREKGRDVGRERKFNKQIFQSLWGATWRTAGLSWGNYAIVAGTSIVMAQVQNPILMANFLMTKRVVDIISGFAKAPFYTNIPKIYELAARKNFQGLKEKASEYIFTGLAVMIVAFAGVALIGNWAFDLVHIERRFLPLAVLLVIFITEVLNWHSAFHASIYISTNQIPFLIPSTVSGALIIAVGMYVMPIYGLMGLVLAQFFIQLAFNNWFAVWLSLRLLKWNLFHYLRDMPYYGIRGIYNKFKYLFKIG